MDTPVRQGKEGREVRVLIRFFSLVSLAPRQECRGSLDGSEGFQAKDRRAAFVGFFEIEGEVERPVVEGLVKDQTDGSGCSIFFLA